MRGHGGSCTANAKGELLVEFPSAKATWIRLSVGGIRCDDGRNHACGDGGENVVAVDLTPLVASGRAAQTILAVIDALAAIPVLVTHVVAPFPFPVFHVMMVVAMIAVTVTVVVVILGKYGAT